MVIGDYQIGGSIIVCCGVMILFFLFLFALKMDNRRVRKAKLGNIFKEEESEDGDNMWVITEDE